MIEIASAAMPQLVFPSPLLARSSRRRSPKYAPSAYHHHAAPKNPIHRRQTTPLRNAPSFEVDFDARSDASPIHADDAQIPIAHRSGQAPFRLAVSFPGGFRTPAPPRRGGRRP